MWYLRQAKDSCWCVDWPLWRKIFEAERAVFNDRYIIYVGGMFTKEWLFQYFAKKSLFWDATFQLKIKEVDKMWQAQRVDYLTNSRRVHHLSQQSRRILIAYCINLFLFGVHYPLYHQSLSYVIEKDSAWIFFELASSKTSLDSDRASFSPAYGGGGGGGGAVHRTIKKINCVHPFNFQIFQNGDLTGYIDGSDVKLTSWMRFIRSARHKKEQNLFAFQYLGRIFYRAFKDILPGEEMLVWYDEKYPQYLGIPWTIFDLAAAVPPGRWS